jgi:hypothetical protein
MRTTNDEGFGNLENGENDLGIRVSEENELGI